MDLEKELEQRKQEIEEYKYSSQKVIDDAKKALPLIVDKHFKNLEGTAKGFSPSDYRVLIIDDDYEILGEVMGRMIDMVGYKYEWANNGKEALEMISEYKPHTVIMDNKMPELTGTELIPVIKRDYPGIKILATGQGFSRESLDLCDKVVTKTFEMNDFIKALEDIAKE